MGSTYAAESAGTVIGADLGSASAAGAAALGESKAASGLMPAGQREIGEIRREDVTVSEDGKKEPEFSNDAVAELVWTNYQDAKNFLELSSWLEGWQASDLYYQNPNNDRWLRPTDGRPVRIRRFLIAKNVNTMDTQVHKSIWGNQKPFALQPEGGTSELLMDAWTHLIWVLMKRAKTEYNFGLAGECCRLQGTGVLQPGWEERTVVKKRRRRKNAEPKAQLPVTGEQSIPTQESDEFETVPEEVKESWPFLNFRKLGFTLFDPKWSTPNAPEESAGWVIDVDYVNFQALQQMRALPCYMVKDENTGGTKPSIPDDETLINYFLQNTQPANMAPSTVAQETADLQSSLAAHAVGEWKNYGKNPFDADLMVLTMWTGERAQAILCYDGRKLTIRNDEHDMGDHALHYTFNWWNRPVGGWGIGIGELNLDDQRMEVGVLNEVLKMIGMWFNTPLLIRRGENAPTQNVVTGLGTFLQVDVAPGRPVTDAAAYLDKPQIPAEAWKLMDMALHGGEDLVGANSTAVQGNLGGPGSSAMRTATGVNRVGGQADQQVAKPVLFESMALERWIYFLIEMVKLKMPLEEIRQILRKKYSDAIIKSIDLDAFLCAEFTVNVLAGQRMMAKQAIQQLIPFILQILQQPQIQNFYNQIGMVLDYAALFSILIRMSELDGNIDNIFRPMTPRERVTFKQNNPGAQKVQGAIAVEQQRGRNKLQQVQAETQGQLVNKLVETAAEHNESSIPLEEAFGRSERQSDIGQFNAGEEQ
jgi:hypothetical protein